jgi:hypothetical protein
VPIPYHGEVDLGGVLVTVVINDLDASAWAGKILSTLSASELETGAVEVELREGDREAWTARAHIDRTGALRGDTAFTLKGLTDVDPTVVAVARPRHGGEACVGASLKIGGGVVLRVPSMTAHGA